MASAQMKQQPGIIYVFWMYAHTEVSLVRVRLERVGLTSLLVEKIYLKGTKTLMKSMFYNK